MPSDANEISEAVRQIREKLAELRRSREPGGGVSPGNLADLEGAIQHLESAGLQLQRRVRTNENPLRGGVENFVTNLSHELRTPLVPALLIVSALQANPTLSDEVRIDLATVREQLELEGRLVDALLDTTQLGRGELRLRMAVLDMRSLLHAAVTAAQSLAAHGPSVTLQFDAKRNLVRGDVARLTQVFANLLQNAMKFTPPDGSVRVWATDEDESIVVSVIDTGRGFDPAILPRLFGAFEKEANPLHDGVGGLGVGLAVAHGLVSLHGGELTAHSDGKDRGATFRMKLRAINPPAATSATTTPAGPAAGQRQRRALRVLLVEDHGQSLLVTARLIRSMGHNVRTASGVATARALLNGETFDLLVADIELSDGTGWELMKIARETGPIGGIALSGHATDGDIAKSRDAGFAQHLVKPITFQRLTNAIEEAVPAIPPFL